jgi:hypothetical protein
VSGLLVLLQGPDFAVSVRTIAALLLLSIDRSSDDKMKILVRDTLFERAIAVFEIVSLSLFEAIIYFDDDEMTVVVAPLSLPWLVYCRYSTSLGCILATVTALL